MVTKQNKTLTSRFIIKVYMKNNQSLIKELEPFHSESAVDQSSKVSGKQSYTLKK